MSLTQVKKNVLFNTFRQLLSKQSEIHPHQFYVHNYCSSRSDNRGLISNNGCLLTPARHPSRFPDHNKIRRDFRNPRRSQNRPPRNRSPNRSTASLIPKPKLGLRNQTLRRPCVLKLCRQKWSNGPPEAAEVRVRPSKPAGFGESKREKNQSGERTTGHKQLPCGF